MLSILSDEHFMKMALKEAEKAFEQDEVPIGAVIVCKNQIIAKAHNQTQLLKDVTAHAEIIAITSAEQYLNQKYLKDCTLYVTLEPCVMCAGALYWSQISKVVFATPDDKRGFMRYGKELLHPTTKLEYGIMLEESSLMLSNFFKTKR